MPNFNFTNQINVKNFIDECNSDEIHELITYLFDRGDLMDIQKKGNVFMNENIKKSDEENQYENALNKLHGKWGKISKLDISIILELSKKF